MSDLPKTLTDKQAMFDAAYIGLAGQGFKRSLNNFGTCMYRGNDGLKCAIGHCIPDDDYDSDIEGIGGEDAFVLLHIPDGLHEFATDLQLVHDGFDIPDLMIERLHKFADDHDLTIPSIEGQS